MTAQKCAHAACRCMVTDGSKYCSAFCENAKDTTTLQCDCGHPACEQQKL